jgi:hypothetical protein
MTPQEDLENAGMMRGVDDLVAECDRNASADRAPAALGCLSAERSCCVAQLRATMRTDPVPARAWRPGRPGDPWAQRRTSWTCGTNAASGTRRAGNPSDPGRWRRLA